MVLQTVMKLMVAGFLVSFSTQTVMMVISLVKFWRASFFHCIPDAQQI